MPRVRRLPARLTEKRILTDTDIVKPVEHPELRGDRPFGSRGWKRETVRYRRTGEKVQYKKIRIKESPTDIVLLPDGSELYGIMPEITLNNGKRLKSAPLRLLRGISSFGRGKGLSHIEDAHGDDIRALGYPNVQAFVWELVNSFDEIWEGTERSLTLVRNRKSGKSAGFIELEKNNEFYEIKSAFPVDTVYPVAGTRKLLWKRHSLASTATGERNPFLSQSKPGHHASIKPEETPQSSRGQSNENSIGQSVQDDKLASFLKENDADTARHEAEHAAWEQLQKDMEEWGRQVDDFDPTPSRGPDKRRLLNVCRTPDVLQKLGAPELPMTMRTGNLEKILSDKQDHQLPKNLVKQLPRALAEPVMVFESATEPDSFVVLTELKHEGRSVMVAVHLDTEQQNIRVNDIASAYKRGNEAWYIRQIEDGRLLYQDKKKSLEWARTHRLQLPKVRRLPARLSEGRIPAQAVGVK